MITVIYHFFIYFITDADFTIGFGEENHLTDPTNPCKLGCADPHDTMCLVWVSIIFIS